MGMTIASKDTDQKGVHFHRKGGEVRVMAQNLESNEAIEIILSVEDWKRVKEEI